MTQPIALPALAEDSAIRHGFFTREGGVSRGVFASLNCGFGSGDARADVAENRARALAAMRMEGAALLTVHQRHTAQVALPDAAIWEPDAPPVADAIVTAAGGRAIGVLTADCAPVLLADAQARVIGAAHAGWRGALAGVIENTVAAMEALGARRRRIVAAIGPCIGVDSYEVGPEFPAPFLAEDAGAAALFGPRDADGRCHFDLPAYVARRLARAGVGRIEIAARDTCAEAASFFSFRRATKQGERDYGRLLSAIALGQ